MKRMIKQLVSCILYHVSSLGKKHKIQCAILLLVTCYLLPVTCKAQVVAGFSANQVKGCAPLVVNFTDHSTGGATSWNWNLGNGVNSSFQNPSAVYTNSGVYSVTLTVSNGGSSNTVIQTNYITVYANPTAGFTLNTYTACVGQPVKYTNATVIGSGGAAISNWAWDFGDGHAQTVTTTTVSHSYSTPGNYPISLIVTDANGCTSTKTETVVIVPPPTPAFIANPVSGCAAPLSVTFTNSSTSSGATTYTWHFGDGGVSNQTNPAHTYTANGSYNVTLIVNQSGCIDSVVIPNYINIQNMNTSFVPTPSVVCSGQSITFTNTSVPAAIIANWSFGDGGTSTTINPVYTYTAAGTYTVSLAATGAGGCSGNATSVVTVNQTPVAAFIADTMVACSVPFVVTFTNNSTSASTYHWNFGDGNTSASTNPVNTYTAPGTYTVILKAINNTGTCSDSIVKNSFIIISPPVAGFTSVPDSGCVPLPVNFTSNSSSLIDPITSYTWSYGDGNTGITTVGNATNTYTVSGIFSPTLTVQTGRGCTNTFVCTNCIKAGVAPVANFTAPDSVCYGSPVMFTNTSTGATGWQWIFGDGQIMNIQNAIHIYGDTGKYQIKLVAYNNGCTDTSLITPVVVLAPKAQLTYTLSCVNYFTVNFTSTSEGADSLVWKFGDGTQNTSNTTHPVHTYTATGAVTCTLLAYNYKSHCIDSAMVSFTIAKPVANFTESDSNGCYPFTPVFTSTSQDANIYLWNFGDATSTSDTSIIANPSYTYNHPGKDLVTLVITDVNGCKDSITKKLVSIGPVPYFHANKLTGCAPPGLLVTFTDSTISDSAIVQWNWNFGDGHSLSYTVAPHFPITNNYTNAGSYNVTLVVTDKHGCKDSLTKVNYINPTYPVPTFTNIQFSCKGDVITFNASTTNAVGPQYSWNFDDGTTAPYSYNPITTHSYTADNLYHVTLTVKDTNGCTNIYSDTVLILKPQANFDTSIISTGCKNTNVSFQDLSSGYPSSWQWSFGDGGTSSFQNVTHQYTTPGTYTVTLIVTNAGGCGDTITKNNIVTVPGPIGTFTYSPLTGCNPLTVTFIAHSANSQNYTWDFSDGTVITGGDSIVHTYSQPGVFIPICLLGNTTSTGVPCENSLIGTTPITVINGVNVTITPTTLALGEDSTANVAGVASNGHAPYTYSWTPSTSNISCITCPDVNVTGTGDTLVYTLTATDVNGCQGIATLLVLSTPCIDKKRIPNIFTPNGDNRNDGFYIPGLCPEENYSLLVYDRWGSLQFTATERNQAWDGKTTKGADAPDGTYFFIVKVNGTTYKGFVQLIR